MLTRVEPVAVHTDERGFVTEPLADFAGQRNCHVATGAPGTVRGNHFHRRTTEVLTVVGPALVRLSEADGTIDYAIEPGRALRFTIPPGVGHAVQNNGSEPNLLIAFTDRIHDPDQPDVIRVELI